RIVLVFKRKIEGNEQRGRPIHDSRGDAMMLHYREHFPLRLQAGRQELAGFRREAGKQILLARGSVCCHSAFPRTSRGLSKERRKQCVVFIPESSVPDSPFPRPKRLRFRTNR